MSEDIVDRNGPKKSSDKNPNSDKRIGADDPMLLPDYSATGLEVRHPRFDTEPHPKVTSTDPLALETDFQDVLTKQKNNEVRPPKKAGFSEN